MNADPEPVTQNCEESIGHNVTLVAEMQGSFYLEIALICVEKSTKLLFVVKDISEQIDVKFLILYSLHFHDYVGTLLTVTQVPRSIQT
jgi:hypothetical protein